MIHILKITGRNCRKKDDIKDGIKKLTDASTQMSDGLNKLSENNETLQKGANQIFRHT